MEKVVLLSKTDRFSRAAQQIAASLFADSLTIAEGAVGDRRPVCLSEGGEYLISFLSPWIITAEELARFDVAINFHPGSVEYPGTGCYNFALYEGASEYGAVCHHMLPRVDAGKVIREDRFPVSTSDTVETLKLATMTTMLDMYRAIVTDISNRYPLPQAATRWTRRAFTRREMNALKLIEADMNNFERDRRIRATVYPGYPGPTIRHHDGSVVAVPVPHRDPLA